MLEQGVEECITVTPLYKKNGAAIYCCTISGLLAIRRQLKSIETWAKTAGFQAIACEPADVQRLRAFVPVLEKFNYEPEKPGSTMYGKAL